MEPRQKEATMASQPASASALVQLAHRENDGIDVTLVWDKRGDRRIVFVLDSRSGELLTVPVGRDNALDVFYHPFAYAAARAPVGLFVAA
jgi:hypothetical protein